MENVYAGVIENFGILELFYQVATEKRSGSLQFWRQDEYKNFYFEEGRLIVAVSSRRNERLLTVLADNNIISDDVRNHLETLRENPEMDGYHLIKDNVLDARTLKWWTKVQTREILSSISHWLTGNYRFLPDATLDPRVRKHPVDTLKLIRNTIQRINDMLLYQSWFGNFANIPTVNPDMYPKSPEEFLKISAQEGFILSRIDGKMNLKQILTLFGSKKLESCKFLYKAFLTGIISLDRPVANLIPAKKGEVGSSGISAAEPVITSVTLTSEELRDLAEDVQSRKEAERKRMLEMEIKLVRERDGEGEEIDGGEALDITKLGKMKEKLAAVEEGDDRLIYIIDGEEVDANAEVLLGGGKYLSEKEEWVLIHSQKKSIDAMWEEWIRRKGTVEEEDPDQLFEKQEGEIESRWMEWQEMVRQKEQLEKQKEASPAEDAASTASLHHEIDQQINILILRKKQEIIYHYRRSQTQSHYEILGLAPDSTQQEINEAYFKWSQEFHPGAETMAMIGTVDEILEILYERVITAYETLSNARRREEYDAFLSQRRKELQSSQDRRNNLAEQHYENSCSILKKGDTKRGLEYLRAAISLNPHEPRYFILIAETLRRNSLWFWEAMKNYNRAIKLEPENASLYLSIGKLFIDMKRKTLAQKAINMALRFDAGNSEARAIAQILG